MYNPEVETASRAEMESLQMARLKKTISHVYENVPYYREKFREMGLEPEDIQTLNDVRKLPFTKNRRFVISIHSVYLPFRWRM